MAGLAKKLMNNINTATSDKAFMDTFTGGDVLAAYKQYQLEAPIRQQENIARAGIDLGLENTPEIIAGGTAKGNKKRRSLLGLGKTASSIASSLGINL